MADIEKVTEWLNEIVNTLGSFTDESEQEVCQLAKDALELLKEQEAVEPIPFFTETGEESKNYVVCGNCKSISAIMPKATKQKYCHECGFPVLWEGR